MAFELPDLPWPSGALDPYVSSRTIDFHHGKHHATYVTKLNQAIEGSPLAEKSLEAIIRETAGDAAKAGIFNNAAQTWNHTFFWNSMKPKGGGEPTGDLKVKIGDAFGQAMIKGTLIPILFTNARDGVGVPELLDAIAQRFGDNPGILDECFRRSADWPAACVLQHLGQVPMVQRDIGCDACLKQRVNQTVVKVQTSLVSRASSLRQDTRPCN